MDQAPLTNLDAWRLRQDRLDILYQEELRMYLERKKHLHDNKLKVYCLIISNYCTKQMKTRIEEHLMYLTMILDNPVKLLEKIKALTHNTIRAQYPIASITEHLARWVNTKQYDNKNLTDYVKQSSYHHDIANSQIGTKILPEYVKTTAEYTSEIDIDTQKELLAKSFRCLSTYVMIRSADHSALWVELAVQDENTFG